jgi:ArsR family transcriptional regulator
MRDFMTIVKALADENRARAILALQGRELCVCQIIELLGLAPSTVSKHMSILYQARLVESRKQGRWIHYRLAGDDAPAEVREAIDWACRSLSRAASIREDAGRLKQLLKLDPEELCRNQRPTDRQEAKKELRARVS